MYISYDEFKRIINSYYSWNDLPEHLKIFFDENLNCNCINCTECIRCYHCIDCQNCQNCEYCENCHSCFNCHKSNDLRFKSNYCENINRF